MRKHAQQENEAPSKSAKGEIGTRRQKDSQRPPTLHYRVEQPAVFRRGLFIDDGDGNSQFRVSEARSNGAH